MSPPTASVRYMAPKSTRGSSRLSAATTRRTCSGITRTSHLVRHSASQAVVLSKLLGEPRTDLTHPQQTVAPGCCDSRLKRPHAELAREGLRLVKKCSRPPTVTGCTSLQQHVRKLELRVGQPGLRPHSLIHGQCLVKVRFGFLPPAHRGGKLPQEPRTRPKGCPFAGDDGVTGVRRQQPVKNFGTVPVAERCADFHQEGNGRSP